MATGVSRRVRLRRWLGLDGNPLGRTSDRIEAWVTMLLVVAFVPLAVLVTTTAVRWVHQSALREEASRPVPAVALVAARVAYPAYGVPDKLWVPVRWTIGHTKHIGRAPVPYGTRKGERVRIWLGPGGRPVSAPLTAVQSWTRVITAVVLAPLVLAEILTLAWALLHWLLNRRRLAGWGTEWQSFDRQQARP